MILPILMYHTIDDDPLPWVARYAVARKAFLGQLGEIVDSGRDVVPLDRAVAALAGGPPLPASALVLTFDDGFADFHDIVQPALAARGLPATLYMTTGAVVGSTGSRLPYARMLSWPQLAELEQAGIDIGAHTRTHPQLDTLPRSAAASEIAASKRELEDTLGCPVSAFAYPYGLSSKTVRELVRESGFASATAVLDAFSSPDDDPFRMARLSVLADTPPERFTEWLAGRGAATAPFPEDLGTRAYRSFRRGRALLRRPGPALTER